MFEFFKIINHFQIIASDASYSATLLVSINQSDIQSLLLLLQFLFHFVSWDGLQQGATKQSCCNREIDNQTSYIYKRGYKRSR